MWNCWCSNVGVPCLCLSQCLLHHLSSLQDLQWRLHPFEAQGHSMFAIASWQLDPLTFLPSATGRIFSALASGRHRSWRVSLRLRMLSVWRRPSSAYRGGWRRRSSHWVRKPLQSRLPGEYSHTWRCNTLSLSLKREQYVCGRFLDRHSKSTCMSAQWGFDRLCTDRWSLEPFCPRVETERNRRTSA